MIRFRQKISTIERKPSFKNTGTRAYSYYDMRKKHEESSGSNRSNKKRRIALNTSYVTKWLVVAAVLSIAGSLIYASGSPILRIDDNEIAISDEVIYLETARSFIKKNIFSRTKITFDYLDFASKMVEKYPEIASVQTSFALIGNRPVVRLTFHKPAILVTSLGRTWIVDDRGVAIAKYQENMAKLPKLNDEIGVAVDEGDTVVSSLDVMFITQLQKVAIREGLIIDKYTTPIIPKQLDVRVVGEGYYTKFNLNDDPAAQIGTWIAARDNLKKIGAIPIEYLDIRAAEKVYWK